MRDGPCDAEKPADAQRCSFQQQRPADVAPPELGEGPAGDEAVDVQGCQRRSFRNSVTEVPEFSFGLSPTKPIDMRLVPWERFLAGEVLCPCCSFWLLLAVMTAMAAGGLAGGFKLNKTGMQVFSSDIVQLYHAQRHLKEVGCKPGAVFDSPVCSPAFQVSDVEDQESAALHRPRSLPGKAVLIMYEATGTNCPGDECATSSRSLLTERTMKAMKKFEDTLFGSQDFQDNYCLLWYPSVGDAAPVCVPPFSMLGPLFSSGQEVAHSVEELFETGFGGLLGGCMCSLEDGPCEACASEGAVNGTVDCMMAKSPSSFAFIPESRRADNATLRAYLASAVDQACASLGGEACQYAAPMLSPLCSTPAWDHTRHGSDEPLSGAELDHLLHRVCDPMDTAMFPLRHTALPSFACDAAGAGGAGSLQLSQHGTPFLMSVSTLGHSGSDQESLEGEYAEKLWDAYQEAVKEAERDTDGELRPMMLSEMTLLKSMQGLLIHDCALAIGSFLVVFLYMWFSTETLFLSSMGMLQIVMSVPPAFLIWKVLHPGGVEMLQFLSIFMILGIGADDVFVLVDAWKQARMALSGLGTRSQVFAVGYRRALSAMLTTTTTTGAAFLFGALSPIPAVSQFCLFACMVVVFDFLWCISFFASSLCIYERYFAGTSFCCRGGPRPAGSCGGPGCCWGGIRVLRFKAPSTASQLWEPTDARALERFCSGPLFEFARRFKVPLLTFWLVVTAASGVSAAAMLKTASKPPEMGNEKHDLVRFNAIMQEYFPAQDQEVVTVSWGLPSEGSVSEFESTDPIAPNVALLDSGAELLTTPEGQRSALALCRSADEPGERCETGSCLVYGSPSQCQGSRDGQVWALRKVDVPSDPSCTTGRYCFIEWVAEYASHHASIEFPVPEGDFVPLLQSEGFARYMTEREAAQGEAGRHWDSTLERRLTGWIIEGGELKFAWMTFNASFKAQDTQDVSSKWYERWEEHVNTKVGTSGAQQSSEMYVFMVLQNELLSAAIQGVFISLVVTAVVLVVVTFNWVLALVGLLNISIITAIFLGIMPLIPWELGSNECIFLIAVVGLAVDYTVHLLHAYNEQDGTREQRMQGALATMGISVASGAITTMGAGVTLFMCDIAFFQQYGSFIFLVILISLLLALTNLPPLILILGPEGDRGKVGVLYRLRSKFVAGQHVQDAE